jgi:hypothetical protein
MRNPMIDDYVRLTCDIPELALSRGQVGVVRSRRQAPDMVFEVEFHRVGHDYQTWAWLSHEQVAVEEGSLLEEPEEAEPA